MTRPNALKGHEGFIVTMILETIKGFINKIQEGGDEMYLSIPVCGSIAMAYSLHIFRDKLKSLNIGHSVVYNPRIRGKSNSLILFSSDFTFVIKIIRKSEFLFFLKTIQRINNYQSTVHGSLLVQYYGVFQLDMQGETIYFVIMKNVFKGLYREIYDFKGASVNRTNREGVLTENDWRAGTIRLPNREQIVKQIRRDTEFLESIGVMDYSLIIGRCPVATHEEFKEYSRDGARQFHYGRPAQPYSIAIVDTLTEYTIWKRLETLYYYLCCRSNMSATNPNSYRKRFLKLIEDGRFSDELLEDN